MSYQAYHTASSRAEDPRTTEYRLLGQVTKALMDLENLNPTEIRKRAMVLDWNRRVWSAFAMDCGDQHNQLSDQLRASIISLSIFIAKETSEAMRGRGDVETLISINRTIMQGLAPN